jgi:hypothetical protein
MVWIIIMFSVSGLFNWMIVIFMFSFGHGWTLFIAGFFTVYCSVMKNNLFEVKLVIHEILHVAQL